MRRTPTRDAVTVLLRGWRSILVFTVAFGLIGLAISLIQKPVYEATVTMYVTSGTDRQASAYETVMGSQNRVDSYARLIYADAVLAPAVKASGLNMTVDKARAAVVAHTTPETVLLGVSAKDRSPEVARRLAGAVADSMADTVAKLEIPSGGGPPTSRLTEVNPATVAQTPVSPSRLLNIILALVCGLFVGIVYPLARERFNDTVRDEGDVEAVAGSRPLAIVPHDQVLGDSQAVGFGASADVTDAAFRHARNGLKVARSYQGNTGTIHAKTIVVTSPRGGQGKTTVSCNLAAAFAEGGDAVVLVDADLYDPAVGARLGSDDTRGLVDAVEDDVPVVDVLQVTDVKGLSIVGAGHVSDRNPAAVLASDRCGKILDELAKSFDYVIVDAPAYLDGPDTEAVTRWADGVLVVVRERQSKISDLKACLSGLSDADVPLVGAVLNDARVTGRDGRRLRRAHKDQPPNSVVGESVVGESVVGESVVGESVVGESASLAAESKSSPAHPPH